MDTALLAHQGGWDEALMVLVPIAVFAGLLVLANRRARAIQAKREAARTEVGGSAPDGGSGAGNRPGDDGA